MSAYDWPRPAGGPETVDDAAGRRAFMAPRRTEIALDEALAAGRRVTPRGSQAARERAARGGLFGQPTGVRNLWLPLGPMTVLGGQTEGKVRVSGRVRALAVHPRGERLYAAAANGGIWYSSDAGGTWTSIGGLAATDRPGVVRPAHRHACGAILLTPDRVNPDDAGEDRVMVGTGEMTPDRHAKPGSNLGGVGILVAKGPSESPAVDPWTIEAGNLAGHGVHRLAAEPGGDRVVAATSIGLFERPAVARPDRHWTRVPGTPFGSLETECTDVLWTAGGGGRPARLWVWVSNGPSSGLWVRAGDATDFEPIPTPNAHRRRAVLAASEPPTTVYVFNDRHNAQPPPAAKLPALYRVDATGTGLPTAAEVVDGMPNVIGTQGFWDMAIAVHPANPNRVFLGGSGFNFANVAGTPFVYANGAIFSAEVGVVAGRLTYGRGAPPAMIGVGSHADVHDLRFAAAVNRLYAGGDGGVFRSDRTTEVAGFTACNDGLAVIEANYVASHPACEGHVVVGLQDNGVIERVSSGVWRRTGDGDGGGVAFDPTQPGRYFRQYFNAAWTSTNGAGFDNLLTRGGAAHPSAADENRQASFYSMPAAIEHARPSGPVGQVLLGTDRLWYTENWGASWFTLPTASDPITAATYDRQQDRLPRVNGLSQPILVCRWAGPDVAWTLSAHTLVRLARTPGTADAGGPGTWTSETLLRPPGKSPGGAPAAKLHRAASWTDIADNPDAGGARRGTHGALYLGTTGHATDAAVDTLWWFDGTATWHPTGLRAEGVAAPVTAILCDLTHPDHVYVGTTVGVWRGVRTFPGGAPDWAWEALVNGLPEAAVEDLSLFEPSGLRLLRAGIAARGIWEVALDADVAPRTYLRAHDDDLRRRTRAVERRRDGVTLRSWHGSPDVRPRPATAAIRRPDPLGWQRTTAGMPRETLRRFQAALRSLHADPRSRPTGEWDLHFEEVLRSHGAPEDAGRRVLIDRPFWDSVMIAPHATAEPWPTAVPSEADLHEFTPPLGEGDAGQASCTVPPGRMKVEVVVHHRGMDPIDGGDVRVTLLHWIDPRGRGRVRPDDLTTTFFDDELPWTAAWSTRVTGVLNSAAGTTTGSLPAGWAFTLTGGSRHRTLPGQTLDAARSGIVSFDLDLRGARRDLVVLLVAVVRAGDDIELPPDATLQDLALTHPGVAVRSMRVAA